jgi:hypothetical protein
VLLNYFYLNHEVGAAFDTEAVLLSSFVVVLQQLQKIISLFSHTCFLNC